VADRGARRDTFHLSRAAPGARRTVSPPSAVIKVGGSLSARPGALRRLMTTLESLALNRTLVVVPGGGPFADEVRRVDRRFGLANSPAHWMAVLAMDQYAYVLADLAAGSVVVRRPGAITAGRLNVLAPASWMRRADPLPHSWEVTSDSIAAWVARRLRARMLVLLKDVDGLFRRDPRGRGRTRPGRPRIRPGARAARDGLHGIVDGHFFQAVAPRMPCWIVNGTRPARLQALLETGRTYGTEVIARADDGGVRGGSRAGGLRRRARAGAATARTRPRAARRAWPECA
jgi:5-(aminomethyl)-3-furanmethanol phosphate kinase